MKFGELLIACALTATIFSAFESHARENSIIVQSTTSTKNSGLYGYLLPLFKKDTGITANIVAVGTGQAIRNARNCDGDVLLVHAIEAEKEFVKSGYGVRRYNLMYNDFVIVGPPSDPARITGGKDILAVLRAIARQKTLFASRGDNSGTHKKEMALWKESGVDPIPSSGKWYRETGTGMGATLNAGIGMGAYVLTDRATWIAFKNKHDFKILVEGDKALFNQYGVILVNKAKCPSVKSQSGQEFLDWLVSAKGQGAIAAFRRNGHELFFPNADR